MTSRTALGLTLTVEGASAEELMCGLRAATALFEAAGITPYAAAAAFFKLEGWDVSGFEPQFEPVAADYRAAELWSNAQEESVRACCAGWPSVPAGSTLNLVL